MFQQRAITEQRFHRVRRELIQPNIWQPREPFEVTAWAVPPNADGTAAEPVPVAEALAADFEPITPGTAWGSPWATTWFKASAIVPEQFAGQPIDAILDIGFTNIGPGFQAEGLIWQPNARGDWVPQRGLHPMNHVVRLSDAPVPGERYEFLIEAASNPTLVTFRPEANSDVLTAEHNPIYTLGNCDLAVVNRDLYELNQDYRCIWRWLVELPDDEPRHNELLHALAASLDALDPVDPAGSANAARAELAEVMARPASASAHRISAIGHAHIDSAWLWPIRETIRKCARTFSNALRLMEVDPEFRFGCSQAVQYDWMRVNYPSIFEGIKEAVARGQWIPIGGQWVEADGNITGGESHLRQLLHGQRFFREHFGITCSEVWIPDVFGYPASLPQFFRLGGAERFLTQKLSWNRTNKFPHHTFWWEGIDGSRVFTHFPPVDTYNANFSPRELNYAVHNFRDHGAATRSLMPFGHGDGGGGPSPYMLDQYHRSKNFEGGPRIVIESPAAFFDAAMAEYPDAPVWVGELYFETHRGTYTSQARTKVGNRRAELLLREAELWSALAFGTSLQDGYPSAELDDLWKTVLLHQFHDILPGTSIAWVHREAEATYGDVLARLEVLIDRALTHIMGRSTVATSKPLWFANPAPFDRDEIVVLDASKDLEEPAVGASGQVLSDGHIALRVQAPAMSIAPVPNPAARAALLEPVAATAHAHGFTLDNGIIAVELNEHGAVTSLVQLSSGRELVAPGETANQWHLHHDLPYEYDAWDIEEYYRNRVEVLGPADSVKLVDSGPLAARVEVTRRFRASSLTETFELRAGSPRLDVHVALDWHERNHLLKVAWPLDIATTEVVRDIQYGHLRTPIHTNTSWDAARFEICAHKWIDVREGDFGCALLNNGRYGHDVTRTRTSEGSPSTTVRLTVVKGAQYPDPHADEGLHEFTYALLPHCGNAALEVISEGYRLNMPVRVIPSGTASDSPRRPEVTAWLVRSTNPSVIVEVVKVAENGSGDLIVRVWESLGNRTTTELRLSTPFGRAWLTDALEDGIPPAPSPQLETIDNRTLGLGLRPFQIATIRISS